MKPRVTGPLPPILVMSPLKVVEVLVMAVEEPTVTVGT